MDVTARYSASYDPVIRTVHWLTLLLIATIYAAIWTAHSGLTGAWFRPVLQLHQSLGLSVFTLTIFRLVWRSRARIPKLPEDLPAIQKLAARGAETLLYLLLMAQPVLGLLQTNARGQQTVFFIPLPMFLGKDPPLARQLNGVHELVSNALLILIGLHAAAALFHHFIRRDGVLNAMLPASLRQRSR